MRLVADPSDPDTLTERNRRSYAAWVFYRAYGKHCPDPLTPAERAEARRSLAFKRAAAVQWLVASRAAREAIGRAPQNVVPWPGRRFRSQKGET